MARGGLQPEGRVERDADSPSGSGARGSSHSKAARDRRTHGAGELPRRGPCPRPVHGKRHCGGCGAEARPAVCGLRDQSGVLRAREAPSGPLVQIGRRTRHELDPKRCGAMTAAVSRIRSAFERLAREHRKALIPYVTAGDPRSEVTVPLLHALAAAGADVIELGVPFSDPMADGPVIQRSSERALAKGVSLKHVLADVKRFRETNTTTPVVLMGYANPIERMGTEAFAKAAKEAGVDGVLVVDYPPEESVEFSESMRA